MHVSGHKAVTATTAWTIEICTIAEIKRLRRSHQAQPAQGMHAVWSQEADISIPTAAGQLPEQLGKDKGGSPQKAQKGRGGAWGRWWSRRDRNASPEPSARGSSPKPELRERKSRDMSPKKQRKLPEDAPLPGLVQRLLIRMVQSEHMCCI